MRRLAAPVARRRMNRSAAAIVAKPAENRRTAAKFVGGSIYREVRSIARIGSRLTLDDLQQLTRLFDRTTITTTSASLYLSTAQQRQVGGYIPV